jgi:hypothetical protein
MTIEVETINETEMFTEALVLLVGLGGLTIDQLKSQLEGGLAYAEAQGADKVPEEFLIALVALDEAIWRVTSSVCGLGADRIPAVDAPNATAPASSPGPRPRSPTRPIFDGRPETDANLNWRSQSQMCLPLVNPRPAITRKNKCN